MKYVKVLQTNRILVFSCFLSLTFVLSVFSQDDSQETLETEQKPTHLRIKNLNLYLQEVVKNESETIPLQAVPQTETGAKLDLSAFLLKSSLTEKGFYHTPNGTLVKYRQVRQMVSAVSGNETLLKQERRWRVVSRTLMGVFLSSTAVSFATSFMDDDTYNKIDAINANVFELSLFSWILTGIAANVKLQKAVDNYNYRLARPER